MKALYRPLGLLLALCLMLTVVGCGNDNQKDSGRKKNEDFSALNPYTELPTFSADFQAVVGYTHIPTGDIQTAMGYVLAAYAVYNTATFCEYMYTQEPLDILNDIADTISATAVEYTNQKTSESLQIALDLSECTVNLRSAAVHLSGWCVHYGNYRQDIEEKTKIDDLIRAINEYAQVFYGQNLL